MKKLILKKRKLKMKKNRSDATRKKLVKIIKKQIKLVNKMLKNQKARKVQGKNAPKKITILTESLKTLNKELNKIMDKMGPMSSNQVQFIGAS
jgi:hypothetical protein